MLLSTHFCCGQVLNLKLFHVTIVVFLVGQKTNSITILIAWKIYTFLNSNAQNPRKSLCERFVPGFQTIDDVIRVYK